MSSLFCDNPDSFHDFECLQQIDPQPWTFTLSTPARLSALGLSPNIYSNLKPQNYDLDVPFLGCPNLQFHSNDIILQEFLWNSLSKRDILKPYSQANVRHKSGLDLYRIQNATVISTPLSIAVLDEDLNIIAPCSHNAPEAVLKWFLSNQHTISIANVDKSILANVQQTFNLGHWFIDSLSRLYAVQSLVNIPDYSVLIDTCKNDLSKSSLSFFNPKCIIETLPSTVFRVEELLVPVVSDFSSRCLLAHSFISKLIQHFKPTNSSIIDLCKTTNPLKIYLSRQNVSRRKFVNGDEVRNFLSDFGYLAISPEKFSFYDIAYLMGHATSIVGGNGAALCNMISSPLSSLSVGIIYPHSHFDDYYFRVSQSLGNSFSAVLSQAPAVYQTLEQSIQNYYYPRISDDYYLSLDRLEFLVNALESFS
tara:strand:- start:3534 stop:4796 length:1263 start_codon:yes stop_codon:yes gene_type:complete